MPPRAANDCFLFDPISGRELADAHAQAKQLSDIIGEDKGPDGTEVWVIAEPQQERFAETVETSILGDTERCALLGRKGAAYLEEDDEESEVVIERVCKKDLAE